MLIPFPIALLTAALLTDAAHLMVGDEFWARASLWLLAAGLGSGLVAATVGLIDFATIERARSHRGGWIHFLGNAAVLVITAVNWLARLDDPVTFVSPWGVGLSAVTTLLLVLTGWTGGELSYRYQIGVVGPGRTT